jgi:hypothetical protein
VDLREKGLRWQRDRANGVVIWTHRVEASPGPVGHVHPCVGCVLRTFAIRHSTNLLAVMQRRPSRASSARASIKVAIDPARCLVCERSLNDAGGQYSQQVSLATGPIARFALVRSTGQLRRWH